MHGGGLVPSCLPRVPRPPDRTTPRKRSHTYAPHCELKLSGSNFHTCIFNSPRLFPVREALGQACCALKATGTHSTAERVGGRVKTAPYRTKKRVHWQHTWKWFLHSPRAEATLHHSSGTQGLGCLPAVMGLGAKAYTVLHAQGTACGRLGWEPVVNFNPTTQAAARGWFNS